MTPDLTEQKSELWVTILGMISAAGAALLKAGVFQEGTLIYIIVSITVMVIGYVLQRGFVKARKFGVVAASLRPVDNSISLRSKLEPPPPMQ